uniref:Uncharacterized protein n=1 Tax=Ditylenchus dipsaci TaxID=166011 RepID=A0A915CVD4_9BILA
MSVDAVTGHQLVINRNAKVNLTVAGETREITMYMTPDKAMGKRVAFDLIIGGDAMKKFPPYTVDFEKGVFSIAGKPVRMGDDRTRETRPMRVLRQTVLRPGTESVGITDGIFTVVANNEYRVLVSNATQSPMLLEPGTSVANAVGLYRDDELLFEHPFITAAVINHAPEVLEIDPTFKVDLSGCEVTADERR